MEALQQFPYIFHRQIEPQTWRQNPQQTYHEHQKYPSISNIDVLLKQDIEIRQVKPRPGRLGSPPFSHNAPPYEPQMGGQTVLKPNPNRNGYEK